MQRSITIALAVVLLGAASAQAATPTVAVERSVTESGTEFTVQLDATYCVEILGCAADINLSIDGRPENADILAGEFARTYFNDYEYAATYAWDCGRSGRHAWRVTITPDPDEAKLYGIPTPLAHTLSGTFRVPSCGPFRPRRVSRGHAAALAARGYPREYVSSSRCVARGSVFRGRSSRWDCVVTHNNTIRECRTRWSYRFEERKLLDDIQNRQRVTMRNLGCTFF